MPAMIENTNWLVIVHRNQAKRIITSETDGQLHCLVQRLNFHRQLLYITGGGLQ